MNDMPKSPQQAVVNLRKGIDLARKRLKAQISHAEGCLKQYDTYDRMIDKAEEYIARGDMTRAQQLIAEIVKDTFSRVVDYEISKARE